MQNGAVYIKDSNEFKSKIKNIDVPINALLVIDDVSGLYRSISQEAGLSALRETLDERTCKEHLTKMAEFVLKNNFFFEFDTNVYQQMSAYSCYFMDQLETKFLENQNLKPLAWLRSIDDILFIWTHDEENL